MSHRKKHPVGVRPWKGGLQAYVQVNKQQFFKSFAADATDVEIAEWKAKQRKHYGTSTPTRGSFEADINAYLKRVSAMPTIWHRTRDLQLWAQALGGSRRRDSITTAEIDEAMQRWLLEGVAPATVRKRRTSLLSMWNKLDGKDQPNPVRASSPPRAPHAEARGVDYSFIKRVLAALPISKTEARIRVIAWTGLPESILEKIQADDLDLAHRRFRASPRRKGKGVAGTWVPLLPQGVEAFKHFHELQAYGTFAGTSADRSLVRACRRAQALWRETNKQATIPKMTLYTLRHSFGTMIYRVTRDLETTKRFMLHASLTTTVRYTKGAEAHVDRAAARKAGEAMRDRRKSA